MKYDSYNRVEPARMYLANIDNEILCCLNGVNPESVKLIPRFNNTYTLDFKLDKMLCLAGVQLPSVGYDFVGKFMRLYIENVGWFIMAEPSFINDGHNESKQISAQSIEIQLLQRDLFGFKVNQGTTDSMELLADGNVEIDDTGVEHALEQVKFYNKNNPDLSLLHLVLKASDMHGWTIGEVDNIAKKYVHYEDGVKQEHYTFLEDEIGYFDIPSQSVYSFYTQDMAKFFECVIWFDIQNMTVNATRIENVGKDTNVTIGLRNLQNTNEVTVNENSIYTRYRVSGGDDLGITFVNFGSNMIENISYYLNEKYLSADLIKKYKLWYSEMNSKRITYAELSRDYNTQLNVTSELKNRLPLDDTSTDWSTFPIDDLHQKILDYQAQLRGIEALFEDAHGIVDWDFLYASELADSYNQIVDYIIPNIEIALENKNATSSDALQEFIKVEDWTLYGVDELHTKIQVFTGQRETYIRNGYNVPYTSESGNTEDYHTKCYEDFLRITNQLDPNFMDSCAMEYEKRKVELGNAEEVLEQIGAERQALVRTVQKETWESNGLSFSEKDLQSLSSLYNDTDYTNEYMFLVSSDDQVTTIDEQLKLLQAAEEDLVAVSQPQYIYTTTLDNFIAMYDYKDYVANLEVGDFLRLGVRDDYFTTLRLLSVEYNPMLMDNEITLEFSNMVRSKSSRNDFAYLLDMASNSGKNQIQGRGSGFGKNGSVDSGSVKYIMEQILRSNNFRQTVNNNIAQMLNAFTGGKIQITEDGLIKAVTIEAENGFFQYLQAGLIAADKIVAGSGVFDELDVLVATIKSAIMGTATAETGIILRLTADNAVIDEAFIKLLMAQYISVNELAAGNINTNKINVLSEDGNLTIIGNTQQFKDKDGNLRIQIGEDAEGNFTFILYGEDGNGVLIDQDGIRDSAIADGLVKGEMIADSTIGKTKINWEDAGASMSDTGDVIWNSASITFNGEGLDVQFSTMLNTVDGLTTTVSQVETSVNAVAKSITDKVWQTDIITYQDADGNTISKSIHDYLVQHDTDISGFRSVVSAIETDFDTLTERVTTAIQDIDGFKQTVESTYATKGEVSHVQSSFEQRATGIETSVGNLEGDMTNALQTIDGFDQRVEDAEGRVSSAEQTVDGMRQTVQDLDGNVTTLATTIDGVEQSVSDINGNVASLTTTVNGVASRVTDNEDNISQLQLNIDGFKTTVQSEYATKSQLTQTAGELNTTITAVRNDLAMSGNQILRNTNNVNIPLIATAHATWANGRWGTYGGGGTYTKVSVSGVPDPNITQGIRLAWGTGDAGISQFGVPLSSDTTYTLSVWARLISGNGNLMLIEEVASTDRTSRTVVATSTWQRFSYTFIAKNGNTRISFNNRTPTGVIEICGMQLEAGSITTSWSESPWDSISAIQSTNLLPNSTWNLGCGDWRWGSNNSSQIAQILPPTPDKPYSSILRLLGNTSTSQQVWQMPYPIKCSAGDTYYISFDVRILGYSANSNIFTLRNFATPSISNTQANSQEYIMYSKSNLASVINSNTTGFVRVYLSYTVTRSGYLALIPYSSNASGAEIIDFREIMVTKNTPHEKWFPATQDYSGTIMADTEPDDTSQLWCDISESPPQIKHWNGSSWVVVGDTEGKLTTMYEQLTSVISQTADGILNQVTESTYVRDDVDRLIAAQETLLEQTKNAFNFSFTNIMNEIGSVENGLSSELNNMNKYIRFVNGVIHIGIQGNPLELRLANDRMSFRNNNVEVAYISNRTLSITSAEITQELKIGNFILTPSSSGGLVFRRV